MIQAGKMDRLLTLYKPVRTRLSTGEEIVTPTEYGTAWAERKPLRGTERWVAQQVAAEVDERFIIRYRQNLSPICEIAFEGRRYEVTSVTEIGRHEGYEILATARAESTGTPT